MILDKYTSLGVYVIHHSFTLAELFAISGLQLVSNTLTAGIRVSLVFSTSSSTGRYLPFLNREHNVDGEGARSNFCCFLLGIFQPLGYGLGAMSVCGIGHNSNHVSSTPWVNMARRNVWGEKSSVHIEWYPMPSAFCFPALYDGSVIQEKEYSKAGKKKGARARREDLQLIRSLWVEKYMSCSCAQERLFTRLFFSTAPMIAVRQ